MRCNTLTQATQNIAKVKPMKLHRIKLNASLSQLMHQRGFHSIQRKFGLHPIETKYGETALRMMAETGEME